MHTDKENKHPIAIPSDKSLFEIWDELKSKNTNIVEVENKVPYVVEYSIGYDPINRSKKDSYNVNK